LPRAFVAPWQLTTGVPAQNLGTNGWRFSDGYTKAPRFFPVGPAYADSERGAKLAFELRGDLFLLNDDDFELLYEACAHHTDGLIEADATIQTCWDADRLDLGRIGLMPEGKKLCTSAARKPNILEWADGRATFEVVPDLVQDEWGIDFRSP
jgi:hypothetical protein